MKENRIAGKTILLVHAGNLGKKFILQKLKKLGVHIVCLNKEKAPFAIPYVDHWIIADMNNDKECIGNIKSYNERHPKKKISGAITFWEESVLLTSKITDVFNLIGIPHKIAGRVKNKFLLRNFCREHGILSPKHQFLNNKNDIPKIEKELRYPLVIKPIYGACSAFVVKVKNRQEFSETYDYVKNNIKSFWLAPEWETTEIFTEEYIDGDEVDIDILLQNGKIKFHAISDNFNKNKDKFFVDSGQAIPSGLPANDQQKLISAAEEMIEKLGILNGCIHFEAKINKKGVWPIEINMRMGGDYIYSYIKGAFGIDLVENAAKICLGEYINIKTPENPYKYILGWDLQAEYSGILVEQNISEELHKKPYLQEIHLFKEIGDPVLRPPEGYDSLGWLTISGDNLLDAQDNLKEACSFINHKVVEFDNESSVGKTARKNSLSAAVMKKNLLLQAAKIGRIRRISLVDQRNLHIGIIGNKSHFNPAYEKLKFKAITKHMEKTLRERGYKTSVSDFNDLNKTFNELKRKDIDLIFNVAEGIHNDKTLKPQATALLEALQIPYTGSDSAALAQCQNKITIKKLLTFHNIPTAKWDYAYTPNDRISEDLKYPLVVKPGIIDEVFGVNNHSVVKNKYQLQKEVAKIFKIMGKPVLVEEYVEGEEYEICILGNKDDDIKVLPLTRFIFSRMPRTEKKVYSRETREEKNPVCKKIIIQTPPRNISAKLESLISEIAIDTYHIMRCHDYARVTVRVDHEDNPYVIDIEPNPKLDNSNQLLRAAKVIGMDYGDLVEEIIRIAIKRYQQQKTLLL